MFHLVSGVAQALHDGTRQSPGRPAVHLHACRAPSMYGMRLRASGGT